MKQTQLSVDVYILEESDLDGVTEENRAIGDLGRIERQIERSIQETVGKRVTVRAGFRSSPRRGHIPWLNVAGVKLEEGEAIAFFPNGPTKIEQAPEPKPARAAKKAAAKKTEEADAASE